MTESDVTDTMQPLPIDRPIAEGTLVWGSDFNAAVSLLYRWWSILDAPPGTDTSQFGNDLFDDAFDTDEQRPLTPSAHHLDHDDYRLHWVDGELFRLVAHYTLQSAGESERRMLSALLRKRSDGRLVIRAIDDRANAALPATDFMPSYVVNRARATSTQFQAHMDSLTGDTTGMERLMMPVLELHGLVASKADQSSAVDEAMTNVDDLRKTIAGSDAVADNTIRDFAGFSAWFATAPALFAYGLHKLEHFAVTPLDDDRYETVAQYEWHAETVNGAKIETHHPLTWVLVETGEAFMRIEKLLPF